MRGGVCTFLALAAPLFVAANFAQGAGAPNSPLDRKSGGLRRDSLRNRVDVPAFVTGPMRAPQIAGSRGAFCPSSVEASAWGTAPPLRSKAWPVAKNGRRVSLQAGNPDQEEAQPVDAEVVGDTFDPLGMGGGVAAPGMDMDQFMHQRTLWESARTGDVEGIASAVSKGADANFAYSEEGGARALQCAALNGNMAAVEKLASLGADVNAQVPPPLLPSTPPSRSSLQVLPARGVHAPQPAGLLASLRTAPLRDSEAWQKARALPQRGVAARHRAFHLGAHPVTSRWSAASPAVWREPLARAACSEAAGLLSCRGQGCREADATFGVRFRRMTSSGRRCTMPRSTATPRCVALSLYLSLSIFLSLSLSLSFSLSLSHTHIYTNTHTHTHRSAHPHHRGCCPSAGPVP